MKSMKETEETCDEKSGSCWTAQARAGSFVGEVLEAAGWWRRKSREGQRWISWRKQCSGKNCLWWLKMCCRCAWTSSAHIQPLLCTSVTQQHKKTATQHHNKVQIQQPHLLLYEIWKSDVKSATVIIKLDKDEHSWCSYFTHHIFFPSSDTKQQLMSARSDIITADGFTQSSMWWFSSKTNSPSVVYSWLVCSLSDWQSHTGSCLTVCVCVCVCSYYWKWG